MKNEKKAVFIDRDGTLNFDPGYITNIDDFQILEDAPQAVKTLLLTTCYSF